MPDIKHTPGPWRYHARLSASENHKGFYLTGHKGVTIAHEIHPLDPDGNEGEANARLIAAAPDLLQFVENWRDIIVGIDAPPQLEGWARKFNTEARALINKAKG